MAEEIQKLSFEEAMSEMEKTVKSLEEGDLSLEESLKKFEYGMCSEPSKRMEFFGKSEWLHHWMCTLSSGTLLTFYGLSRILPTHFPAMHILFKLRLTKGSRGSVDR